MTGQRRKVFVSSSPEDTAVLARRLARGLPPGSVVSLVGPLGSGKTVFVKGLARGLGLDPDAATSPTFTLIHEYEGKRPLVHVDLYRLEHPDDIAGLGLEEYFEGPGVVAVEWAERAGALMPAGAVEVRFQRLGPERRRVTITEGGSAPD